MTGDTSSGTLFKCNLFLYNNDDIVREENREDRQSKLSNHCQVNDEKRSLEQKRAFVMKVPLLLFPVMFEFKKKFAQRRVTRGYRDYTREGMREQSMKSQSGKLFKDPPE